MSKFEDLQIHSLNKNEMSRDEYLYLKYKTKYLNLKNQNAGAGGILGKIGTMTASLSKEEAKKKLNESAAAFAKGAASANAAASSFVTGTLAFTKNKFGVGTLTPAQELALGKQIARQDQALINEDEKKVKRKEAEEARKKDIEDSKKASEENLQKIKIAGYKGVVDTANGITNTQKQRFNECVKKLEDIKKTPLTMKNIDEVTKTLKDIIAKLQLFQSENSSIQKNIKECNNTLEKLRKINPTTDLICNTIE
jgi:hypothetical protein